MYGVEFFSKGKYIMTDIITETKREAIEKGKERFQNTRFTWRPMKVKKEKHVLSVFPFQITEIVVTKV